MHGFETYGPLFGFANGQALFWRLNAMINSIT
jgi:hypothetical protein